MRVLEIVTLIAAAQLFAAGCADVAGLGPSRYLVDPVGSGGEGGAQGGSGGDTSSGGGGVGGAPDACSSNHVWQQTYGDAQEDRIGFVAPAPGGGVYVSGRFQGKVDLKQPPLQAAGASDIFVGRVDADGYTQWARRFGSVDFENFPDIAAHPDGVVLCGSSNNVLDLGGGAHAPSGYDGFVTLMAPDGAHLWTRWIAQGRCEAVAVDPTTNDIIVLGFFEENDNPTIDAMSLTSLGHNDLFVLRMSNTNGAVTNYRQIGSDAYDGAPALAVRDDGHIVVGGNTVGEIDFGAGPQAHLDQDAFVALLEPDFSTQWAHVYPYAGVQGVGKAGFASNGDVIVVGGIDGELDVGVGMMSAALGGFLARLASADGAGVTSRALLGFPGAASLIVHDNDHTTLSGWYHYTLDLDGTPRRAAGGQDAIVATFDEQLDLTWTLLPDGSLDHDSFGALALDEMGVLFVAGFFHGDLAIDGCPLASSKGLNDAVLLKTSL